MTLSHRLSLLGRDLFLSPEACVVPSALSRWFGDAWRAYADQFDAFTGSRLDPQFSRLALPDLEAVEPVLRRGTVAIVGTGPSLAAAAPVIRTLRQHLSVWTSVRGAEALASHRITPDVAIVQHATDLDAYLTARHLGDRSGAHPLSQVRAVLVERRTPATLLSGLESARVGLVDGAIGWGLWPATLAALACASGADTVALAGIDLGTSERQDPAQTPLIELLSLIAAAAPGHVCLADAGAGAPKRGWNPASLETVVSAGPISPVDLQCRQRSSLEARREALITDLHTVAPLLASAGEAHALALAARSRGDDAGCHEALAGRWRTLLEHGRDPATRLALQDGLGARMLPTMWRHAPIDPPGPLWRPLRLATEEILRLAAVAQRLVDARQRGRAAA